MVDVVKLLTQMQAACPVWCTTSILMRTGDTGTIILQWDTKIGGRQFAASSTFRIVEFTECMIEAMLLVQAKKIRADLEALEGDSE